MCGRYSLACIDNHCGRFRVIDPNIGFRSHFNIAPGSTNPVIIVGERAEAVMMQWGLVPHWARDVAAWPPLFRLPVMWDNSYHTQQRTSCPPIGLSMHGQRT